MASVSHLEFKNLSSWVSHFYRNHYLIQCTKFLHNRITFSLRYADITIFIIAAVRHLGFVMTSYYCIWQSIFMVSTLF